MFPFTGPNKSDPWHRLRSVGYAVMASLPSKKVRRSRAHHTKGEKTRKLKAGKVAPTSNVVKRPLSPSSEEIDELWNEVCEKKSKNANKRQLRNNH